MLCGYKRKQDLEELEQHIAIVSLPTELLRRTIANLQDKLFANQTTNQLMRIEQKEVLVLQRRINLYISVVKERNNN